MNKEIAQYIFQYFYHLLPIDEKLMHKHHYPTLKYQFAQPNIDKLKAIYAKNGWVTDEIEALVGLTDSYDNFQMRLVIRILVEFDDQIYFNNCPKCGKLTRTPQAKQCRFCYHDWHEKQ
jgi:hypothetical protein